MAQTEKNRSVTDFLAIFFIGNHMISQLLSKVVENRTNALYHDTLGLPDGFVLPFFKRKPSLFPAMFCGLKTTVFSRRKLTIKRAVNTL